MSQRKGESDEDWRARSREIEQARPKWQTMLRDAKQRAKEKGLPFSLTKDNIEWPDRCPVFAMTLNYKRNGRRCEDSPTIDRLDNAYGYTPRNCRVVSWRANRLKNDATCRELKMIVEWLEEEEDYRGD